MSDKLIKVSVIVPVYKVEPYLNRCIESIVNQTYDNLQIILVDDGSPDNCPMICDEWIIKDNRISVIHKQNAGLGMARNTGLEVANGDYVCFVDSDDYIHTETIQKLLDRIVSEDADVCYYGCIDVVNGIESTKKTPLKTVYIGDEVQKLFAARLLGQLPKERDVLFSGMSACYAFYKRTFIVENGILFHSEREKYISEDLIFNLNITSKASKVVILPESLYYYVIRQSDSLRSTYRNDRFAKCKMMYEKLLDFSRELNLGFEGLLRSQNYLIHAVIACIKMELLQDYNTKHIKQKLYNYINDNLLREILKEYPINKLCFKQRLFCFCLKQRLVNLVYFLAKLQNKKSAEFI